MANPNSAQPADARLQAALRLIMRIEARLTYGQNLYDTNGRKLDSLEAVIQAILADTLAAEVI